MLSIPELDAVHDILRVETFSPGAHNWYLIRYLERVLAEEQNALASEEGEVSLREQIDILKSEVSDLEGEVDDLEGQVSELEDTLGDREKELGLLKAEIEGLKRALSDSLKTKVELESSLQTLAGQVLNVVSSLESL